MGNRPILLIDANIERRRMLELALGLLEHPLIATDSAMHAMSQIGSQRCALIVFAITSGDLSQLVPMMRIRELPQGRGVPLIALVEERGALHHIKSLLGPLNVSEFIELPADAATVARIGSRRLEGELVRESMDDLPRGEVTSRELREMYTALGTKDYFGRLGLDREASASQVRAAFLKRVNRYKPERVAARSDEERRLLRGIHDALGEAYSTLRDEKRRAAYQLRTQRQDKPRPPPQEPGTPVTIRRTAAPAQAEAALPEAAPPKPAAPPATTRPVETKRPSPFESRPLPTRPMLAPPTGLFGGPSAPAPPPPPPPPESQPEPEPARRARASSNSTDEDGSSGDVWARGKQLKSEPVEKLEDAARLQAVMGDYAGAAELIRQCLRLKPDHPAYKYRLEMYEGWKFKQGGNLSRSKRHFETALALAPPGARKTTQVELDDLAKMSDPKATASGGSLKGLFGFGKKKK